MKITFIHFTYIIEKKGQHSHNGKREENFFLFFRLKKNNGIDFDFQNNFVCFHVFMFVCLFVHI